MAPENLCCNVHVARGIIPVASQQEMNVELVIILLIVSVAAGSADIGGGA